MEIWVLGTLEVSHDGRAVDVRGSAPRRLLALLALSPGNEVSADSLVNGLWGADPPAAASATLQSHVARLRRDLPVAECVRRGRRGYVLDVKPSDVDGLVFEREVAFGSAALVEGRLDQASAILGEALSLWRGTPYAEFADCEPLENAADGLSALRLDALERRISADLGRPGCSPAMAELEALVHWHPMRESFWALLMAGQYRAGRQDDALASYHRARRTLVDEHGLDLSPQVQELVRLIRAQDPSLEMPGMATFLPASTTRAYADSVALVERAHLLETLTGLHDEALACSGRLVLVHGEAGIGKSALVRAWSAAADQRGRVLWGACDPLSSPRPLGPLLDLAPHLDPQVGDLLRSGERDGLFEATIESFGTEPTVVVIEDLQWADMSTLDLFRFLARRLEATKTLVVVTYRDEGMPPSDPLRVMLGDIASQPAVRRLEVPLLSADGVAELVGDSGIDAQALFRETGGNAFFVTEVVASGGEHLPSSVQDAVLARVSRLSPQARLALESSAVIGSRAEPSLVHAMPDVCADSVDECVSAGMLRFEAPAYVFRHELLRQAVLSGSRSRTPRRAALASPGPAARRCPCRRKPVRAARRARRYGRRRSGDPRVRRGGWRFGRRSRLAPRGGLPVRPRHAVCRPPRGRRPDRSARQACVRVLSERRPRARLSRRGTGPCGCLRGTGRYLEAVDALLGLDESYYTIGDNSHGTCSSTRPFPSRGHRPQSAAGHDARPSRHPPPPSIRETQQPSRGSSRALEMAGQVAAVAVTARAGAQPRLTHFLLGECRSAGPTR